ncbi:MAG: helix-turn-helix domain-containing protein [Pirellula sp.]
MSKNRVLYSWIGNNDLLGLAGDADVDQQSRILAALKIDRKVGKQDGPIRAFLKQESFDEIDIKAAIADVPGKRTVHFDYELGDGFCLQTLLEDIQRRYLERAMEESPGVKTKAAELLGMSSYQTLDAQLKRLGVATSKPK